MILRWIKTLYILLSLSLIGMISGSVALADENIDTPNQGKFHMLFGMKDHSLRKHFMQTQAIQIKSFLDNENIIYTDLYIATKKKISFELLDNHQDKVIKDMIQLIQEQMPNISLQRDELKYSIIIPNKTVQKVKKNTIKNAVEVIKNRLEQLGLVGQTISIDEKNNIVVDIVGIKTEEERERILNLIMSQGILEFIDEGEDKKKIEKKLFCTIPIIFASKVSEAKISFDNDNNPIVEYRLRGSDAKRVADFRSKNPDKTITVLLNGKIYGTFRVDSQMDDIERVLSHNLTVQDAHDLAIILRSGGMLAPLYAIKESLDKDTKESINDCKSKSFTDLQLSAVDAFQNNNQKESLRLFKEAYHICPTDKMTKDMVEELEKEVGDAH